METIKSKQIRVIKRGFYNDIIYTGDKDGGCHYLKNKIMGKSLEDIKFHTCRTPYVMKSGIIITKGKTFELYSIDWKHTSSTMYVITVDDKIMYYCFCSIFAPASSAFHTLTEVYFYGHNKKMSWVYAGKQKAECFDVSPIGDGKREVRKIDYKKVSNVKEMIEKLYYHY